MTVTEDRPRAVAAPLAWRPVLLIAAGVALALGLTSARYGYFGDELYFLSAGARRAVGYADQPPMLPWLAAGLDALVPDSLFVLRLPATLLTAATVVTTAATAAELGGRRRAQLLAAGAGAICPYLLETGHLLATSTVDPALWAVVVWLVARWIRQDRAGAARDGLLLAAGLVVAVALADKMLIPVLLAGLAVGVAAAGPRRMLTRPLLGVGAAVAVAATIPTLVWQAEHGWPQLAMGSVVAGERGLFGNRWQFLPRVLYYAGLLPGTVLVVLGVWWLLRGPRLRPWRALGVAVVVVTGFFLVTGARPYYVSGLVPLAVAAGGVAVEEGGLAPRWRWSVGAASFVVSTLLTAVYVLPLGPAGWRSPVDYEVQGQLGWPQLADSVAARYRALPPEQRAHTAVVAYSYWYAAALEHDGPARGLPERAYSTHRGFGYFGPPPDSASTALLVGPVPWAGRFCAALTPLAPHDAPADGPAEPVNGHVPLALCTPSQPWSRAWGSLLNLA